jgi:ABC-type uncharacterized transport system substrate-binding protein
MRRRDLIALFGGAPVMCLAVAVRAQAAKTFHLGILVNTRSDAGLDEFLQGLRDHGYVEGQNLVVELRFSEGAGERWPQLAKELAALKVDAIVVQTTPAALAAKQATSTIPIVITTAIDPVGAGLADSLARPGDNVTGVALLQPEISGKALSLLKEAVPTLRRVAVLWNGANQHSRPSGERWIRPPVRWGWCCCRSRCANRRISRLHLRRRCRSGPRRFLCSSMPLSANTCARSLSLRYGNASRRPLPPGSSPPWAA